MRTTCTIFASDSTWSLAITAGDQVTRFDLPAHTSLENLAESIQQVTAAHRPRRFLLALPSHWCLSATISSKDLPRRDRYAAMCYRLEEKLPLPAEDFTADFIVGAEQTLGVAVPTARLEPFVSAFAAQNIRIEHIVPTTLLAAPMRHDSHVLVAAGDMADLIQYQNLSAIRWYTFPNAPRDIAVHLKALSLPESNVEPRDVIDVAARRAHAILSGSEPAPINLSRSGLGHKNGGARRQFVALAASFVFFLICLNISLLYRAHAYASIVARQQGLQESIFQSVLPNQSLPLDVESRLAAEERRLHLAGDARSSNTLLTLHNALSHLPSDIRYRLNEIALTGPGITLTGESLTHGDAESIAGSLRDHSNWEIAPPHTEQSASNLVSFTITAQPPHESSIPQ